MNVTLETTLPEGLYSESTTRTYDKIAAGQKILHSFTIQVGDKSSVIPVSLSSIPSNPVTGAPYYRHWYCPNRCIDRLCCLALQKKKGADGILDCALPAVDNTASADAFPNPVYAEEESDTDTSFV